jgi:hypothetical protein
MCQHCDARLAEAEVVHKNLKGEVLQTFGQLELLLMKVFDIGDEDIIGWSLFEHEPIRKCFNDDNELLFYVSTSPASNYPGYFTEEIPKVVVHIHWSIGDDFYAASAYYLPGSNTFHTVSRMKPGMRH